MANLCKDSLPDLATAEGQAAFAKAFEPLPDLVLPENLSSLSGHRTGDADALPKVQPFLQALIGPAQALSCVLNCHTAVWWSSIGTRFHPSYERSGLGAVRS